MRRSIADIYPHALVTGASAGLGRAFAEILLADGVRVWGTARDPARLTDLAVRFPGLFTPLVLDLDDADTAEAAFVRSAEAAGGAFDLVINNAGSGVFGTFDGLDCSVWQRQVGGMLGTTMRLTHLALKGMRRRGKGCIVNVSSLAVEFPLPFMSGYNVAKAGLSALTESLIVETRGSDIKVIDFRPGDYRTEFNQSMRSSSPVASTADPRVATAWRALEIHLKAGPLPGRAARDLRCAILRGRSGTVRSGSFFQARFAPLFSRVIPASVRRLIAARYFGL